MQLKILLVQRKPLENDGLKEKTNSKDGVHETALQRFAIIEKAEANIRIDAVDDQRFYEGNHWPEEIKKQRELEKRPCLVINKTPQFVKQITNDQRQNRPAIKVYPVDDNADKDTAKTIQGIIRHIEYNSNSEAAYDTAFESAVKCGLGYYRVITKYADSISFNQEIFIKPIKNHLSVFFDPFIQEPDGSDANYAFITEDISKEEYKRLYPKSKAASQEGFAALGNNVPGWFSGESIRVAEYFYKEFKEETIALLSNGETVKKSDLPEVLPEGLEIVKERTASVPKICWVKMNGSEILEETDWPGIYIPIIPVFGEETNVDGVRILKGVIRNQKDSARMYDYWATAETEAIALSPKAPYLAAEGQLEGYEQDWETANSKNHSVLYYKTKALDGTPVSAPQRNAFEPAIQAITNARMLAADDMKATTGIYDSSLGDKSNETSGIAIQRRNVQAQTSNFHFIDNLTRALRLTGKILVDLIPKIYDTAQSARIIGDDGEQKIIKINQPFMENGKEVLYALDAGKYDVAIDVGPSFQTKRQEAVTSMLELSKANPALMQVAGDLMVKNMDWPGAQEVAERIKKILPPGVIDEPNKDQEIPPQVKAKLEQSQQMIEQLSKTLNALHDERDQKLIELESRERIEMKKLEVQLEIKRAELDQKDSLALLTHEINSINQRLSQLSYQEPIEEEQGENFNFNHDESGEQFAESPMMQPPTGGESPGQPLEGNFHD